MFLCILVTGVFMYAASVNAQGLQYTLLEKIPGLASNDGSNFTGYITAIYNLALVIIVLSAVLMLSVGGFMYLTSAGNTSAMSTAKSVIFDSIIGLVIALTAWLLLNTINPDLVGGSMNSFSITPSPTGVSGATTTAEECLGCVAVTGIDIKDVGQGCASPGPCKLNEAFLNKLKNVTGVSPAWRITEAWPPTVPHSSPCHSKGTCADINFTDGTTTVASVKSLYG